MKQVIICGSNRSGSTSLFEYLSYHPEICPSFVKQTNFFIDTKHITNGQFAVYHHSTDFDRYNDFYKLQKEHTIQLEASPDYMYSENTPQLIKNYFSQEPLLVFILRNPEERLKSWFQYGKQIGEVMKDEKFTKFVEKCKNPDNHNLVSYRALQTNNYYRFLKRFYEIFHKESIHILFFDELKQNPLSAVKNIMNLLNLDSQIYENYDFQSYNSSKRIKNRFIFNIYKHLWRLYHSKNKSRKHNRLILFISSQLRNLMYRRLSNNQKSNAHIEPIDFSKSKLELLIEKKVTW